jgi:hypothetical protein
MTSTTSSKRCSAQHFFIGLGTHADTCCFGSDALLVSQDLNQRATVTPFMSSLGTVSDVPIATVEVAYDCSISHSTIILLLHQVL